MKKLNVYKSTSRILSGKRGVSLIVAGVQFFISVVTIGGLSSCTNTNLKTSGAEESTTLVGEQLEPTTVKEILEPNMSLKKDNELGIELSSIPEESYYEMVYYGNNDGDASKTVTYANQDGGKIVVDKNASSYQVVDEDGNIIEEGVLDSKGNPVKYSEIPGSEDLYLAPNGEEVVLEDQTGTDGNVVFESGDIVVSGAQDRLAKEVPTTRVVSEETLSSYDEIVDALVKDGMPEDAARDLARQIISRNDDVTTAVTVIETTTEAPLYVQYGFTSEEDYERWQSGEEYVLCDGVMVPYTPEFDEAETTEYQKSLGGR